MKKRTRRAWQTAAAVSALAAVGGATVVTVRRREHGWGLATPYGHNFDATQLTTVCGTVHSIARFRPRPDMEEGIEFVLSHEYGLLPVHLGPARWVRAFADSLRLGDAVRVVGCRVTSDRDDGYLMAASVRKGNAVCKLRDDQGRPCWRHS